MVVEFQGISCPRSIKTAPYHVASTESVSTTETNYGPVVETHSVENITKVGCALRGIRKASVRRAVGSVGSI